MDERFENPSDEEGTEDSASEETTGRSSEGRSSEPEPEDRDSGATAEDASSQQQKPATERTESPASNAEQADDEPLNIREDWDSATIYVEPEQSEDIEITFTRLKKQLKREDITLEKNKHFYRGVFEVAFGEHQEETKEKIRELAKQDTD